MKWSAFFNSYTLDRNTMAIQALKIKSSMLGDFTLVSRK